jgi:hypothetical protein
VIELCLRGVFVFAKFKLEEVFSNNIIIKFMAKEALKMMEESFDPNISFLFMDWVQKTIDDRKALNDPFVNPFGPQEQKIDEETGKVVEIPQFIEINTVQDAVGFLALEQIKDVSDQLNEIIVELFGDRPGWGSDPSQQFLLI